MIVYALVKLNQLMSYHNPNLAQIDKPGGMDEAEKFNFRDAGLQFAFTFEGMYSRESVLDPRYVKVITRLYGRLDGQRYEKVLHPYDCT